jgi:hypothetical protein
LEKFIFLPIFPTHDLKYSGWQSAQSLGLALSCFTVLGHRTTLYYPVQKHNHRCGTQHCKSIQQGQARAFNYFNLVILIVIYLSYLIVIDIYQQFCASTDTPHALFSFWVLFGEIGISSVLTSTHYMSLPFLYGSCQENKKKTTQREEPIQNKETNRTSHRCTNTPTNTTIHTDQSSPQSFPSHNPHPPTEQ